LLLLFSLAGSFLVVHCCIVDAAHCNTICSCSDIVVPGLVVLLYVGLLVCLQNTGSGCNAACWLAMLLECWLLPAAAVGSQPAWAAWQLATVV